MSSKRILIIAAHPDDDILGCGGILSKYKDTGRSIRVVFIAEGTSCRYSEIQLRSDEVKAEINRRNGFGIKALEYLGVTDYAFYDLPCGRLDKIPILDINKIIEKEIRNFDPDTVFTHGEHDTNNDHRILFRSTLMSTRPIPSSNVRSVYSYEIQSSSEWSFGSRFFEPTYFVELSEQNVNEKIKALNFYESEVKPYPFPRSEEGLLTNAKYRGMQIGVKYAEAFKLLRTLEK